jgi:hypothetical protein
MRIKKEFELVYRTTGAVYNVVPLSKGTLTAYEISKEDSNHLLGLAMTYNRIKPHSASKIIEKYMKDVVIVNMPEYPLPGFVTNANVPVMNLNPLQSTLITDYTPSDVFALFLYTISLWGFMMKHPIREDNIDTISNMFFAIFMKAYGKKSGLIGSYSHLIPKLRFLTGLYVTCSFFDRDPTISLKQKIGNQLFIKPDELKLDYDFKSIKGYLRAINENDIISLSANTFSSTVINYMGITALPLFEDISRFYATILASTVVGNAQFSGYFKKVRPPLFDRLVYGGLSSLSRVI